MGANQAAAAAVAHPPTTPNPGRSTDADGRRDERVSEKKEREEEKRIQHLRSLRFFAPGRASPLSSIGTACCVSASGESRNLRHGRTSDARALGEDHGMGWERGR